MNLELAGFCRALDAIADYDKADRIYKQSMLNTPPTHHLVVFDFDETLAFTTCLVYVSNAEGDTFSLTPAEFALYEEQPGDVFDFTDFKQCVNARAIEPNIARAIAHYEEHGPSGLIILTARSRDAIPSIINFLDNHNLNHIGIIALGDGNPQRKAAVIKALIIKYKIKLLEFIDDSYKNINAVNNLKEDPMLRDSVIITEHFNPLDYK